MTEVIKGLKLSLAANDQINFIIIDTSVKGEALYEFTDTLEADSVQNICTKNNASILLVLDKFKIGTESETEENEEGGLFGTTANYYLFVSTGLSLYSGSGELINRSSMGRTTLYKSRGALAGIAIFDPSIYKAEKDIKPHLIFLSHMKQQEI